MNTKIFSHLIEKLQNSFNLPKYQGILPPLQADTEYAAFPWTPAKREKFEQEVSTTFQLNIDFKGTIGDIAKQIDTKYLRRFFGEMWRPRTETMSYTGWQLVEEILKHKPEAVLDVGCGYNQFKERVPNLTGIDPFNDNADYMVDILDFVSSKKYDAIMVLGSINFNSYDEVDSRISKVVNLLNDSGRIYFRANPGINHEKGPWIEIFPWNFEWAQHFADRYNLKLETFKQDNNNRLYFVYHKQ
jgi:hypothetical protein